MASKHREPRPPVVSTEETRIRPLEEEAPPADEEESWEAPEDSTRLVLNTSPPQPTWEEPEPEEVTPPVPPMRGPVTPPPSDDATRPIRRNTGARRALDAPAVPWDASKDAAPVPATAPYTLPPLEIPDTPAAKPSAGSLHSPIPTVTQPDYRLEAPLDPASVITAATATSGSPQQTGDKLRTAFANKAAVIADLVRAAFSRKSYGTAAYRLRIDEPDGPSTAGGLLARQPISLVSTQEWAPAIPCGWVDVSKKEAQLRNHAAVLKRHRSRYGRGLDLTEEEYERFFHELVDTLFYGGIKVLVLIPDEQETPPVQAPPRQAPSRSRLGTVLWVVLAFALGVGAGLNAGRVFPALAPAQAGTR
ncbi:hypothetical protein [Stigmatella erecta]|uniref:Uncharacterized protein n=1 Tax=Stigmatella erecta TaxID=83460 RepID=A0A1I0JYH1_9BACT|nr:hypothetical protein [Stigmatella erecta]SEU16095.1 hypothetical protein SAMN05443639_108277 [Stigmatella erecta]